MTTVGDPTAGTEPVRARLARPVLVSNLASGALWILLAALPWNGADDDFESLPLFLIPAAYVVAASLFLAAVYGHEVLTKSQEALAWTAPWLVGVALWSWITIGLFFENTLANWLGGFAFAIVIATPCYLAWQIVALVIRLLMASRSRGHRNAADS